MEMDVKGADWKDCLIQSSWKFAGLLNDDLTSLHLLFGACASNRAFVLCIYRATFMEVSTHIRIFCHNTDVCVHLSL